ncbi:MAG: hypothetical protein RL235_543 [Chlamydiota bacterium]|jgi:acyl-CoA hydrolase
MEPRPVSFSSVDRRVVASDPGSSALLLQIVDAMAADVAKQHSGHPCIASGIDSVRFLNPVKRGDLLVCMAAVNRTWNASMEVGIRVIAEDFRTLSEVEIMSAYFTFVAIDEEHKSVSVPPVLPETPDEIRRYEEAETRQAQRICNISI